MVPKENRTRCKKASGQQFFLHEPRAAFQSRVDHRNLLQENFAHILGNDQLLRQYPRKEEGQRPPPLEAWNRRLKKTEKAVLGAYPDIGVTEAREMVEKLLRHMTMEINIRSEMKSP